MPNILIIKLGAMGDVIRTTPLLRVLDGNIFWVTEKKSLSLLPAEQIDHIVEIEKAEYLKEFPFDLVMCLDDEYPAAALATSLKKETLIGSYIDKYGRLTYTDSASEWFDMGLISKFGKDKADLLKMKNLKTYQEIIFNTIEKKFNGEEYILNLDGVKNLNKNSELIIGIENRAGDRWPMKQWNKYDELAELLKQEGYKIRLFQQREKISEYIKDIADCDAIICGDTLAMHIALALRKSVVSIFTCTSPVEIYGYRRMTKIVSPLLEKYFYKKGYSSEPLDAIPLLLVYNAVKDSCKHLTDTN